ncbi:hypothetical protein [Novosphingobium sp. FSW06-99]|uniref:hypothetical protein n=1 Tax=Novosphingobium sp. FSW06-99 TaxID=1739113 RepID=UPI00076C297B|nr:hypothetical protein [Novosphingobium sp. FSW06-99]KUR80799.1 hypothetical protein AQZ49_01860 [Novosphingobium sp. FSW06-99]
MTARVLIGCERSGVLRRAFIDRGFDAWSCDLEPADDGSNRHIRGNLLDHLDDGWDLLCVMHPPCTILCNSGGRWLYIGGKKANGRDEGRWADLDRAAAFYRACRENGAIARRALENPVMHKHAIAATGRGVTQFVQPWWFGDPFFKATGFELINLPRLVATNRLTPPKPGTPDHARWSRVHRHSGWGSHGADRARARSETYPGMATAIVDQWGSLLDVLAVRSAA